MPDIVLPAADVVIVGAGTAGCVLAAALSEDPRRRVTLIDAGPGGADPALAGVDYLGAASDERFWGAGDPGGLVERVAGRPPGPYRTGRGVGGSAAVNGMVAVPPGAGDLAAWQAAGCPLWSWAAVGPTVSRLADGWRPTPPSMLGPLERALEEASARTGLGVFAPVALERNGTDRASVAERLLTPALARPNLSVLPGTAVTRVVLDGKRVAGIAVAPPGGAHTIAAGEVVLAAGAIRSPLLLAASGLGHVLERGRLADHPSGTFTLHLRAGVGASALQTCGVLRWRTASGAVAELLPIARVGERLAALALAILDPVSTGSFAPAGTAGAVARLGMLGEERDRVAMREAIGDTLRLLGSPAFDALVEGVTAGSLGVPAADLGDASDDVLDRWVAETGPLLHAGCSLPIGTVLDQWGRVPGVGGLRVVDASALPVLPIAAPNATVTLLAAHIAAAWPEGDR